MTYSGLFPRQGRRAHRKLTMVIVATCLVAVTLADPANADNGSGANGEASSVGGAGGRSSQSSNNTAWPPTDVYWPPMSATEFPSDDVTDDSGSSAAPPTPIVTPSGQWAAPDDGPAR